MSDSDPVGAATDGQGWDRDAPDSGDRMDSLGALEDTGDSPEERRPVRDAMDMVSAVERQGGFGRVIAGVDRGDAADALLGSVVFGLPMLVEGGIGEGARSSVRTRPPTQGRSPSWWGPSTLPRSMTFAFATRRSGSCRADSSASCPSRSSSRP